MLTYPTGDAPLYGLHPRTTIRSEMSVANETPAIYVLALPDQPTHSPTCALRTSSPNHPSLSRPLCIVITTKDSNCNNDTRPTPVGSHQHRRYYLTRSKTHTHTLTTNVQLVTHFFPAPHEPPHSPLSPSIPTSTHGDGQGRAHHQQPAI